MTTIAEISNADIEEKIRQARIAMLFTCPFFGNIALRLRLTEGGEWCNTMAVDGRFLYYNKRFVLQLTKKELIFVIAHEVLHCCYDHFTRRNGREPGLWNMANDYVVNLILHEARVGVMPTKENLVIPDAKGGPSTQRVGLLDMKYSGWTSEEVYDDLIENSVEVVVGLDDHIDMHGDGKNNQNGKNGQSVSVRVLNNGEELSEEEKQAIRNEIKDAMLAASMTCKAGDIPGALKRLINEIVEPKMDWRQILTLHIQSLIKNDFTFMRPSKKSSHIDAVLPGYKVEETIDIAICIDMSGSISQEMATDFISEVVGICDQFNGYRIHLWTFDTQVYNDKIFYETDREEIVSYEVHGGGGTDFMCNWRFMEERDIVPDKLLMFTDGYPCGEWGIEGYCDTIFLISGNKTIESPFGLTIHYDEYKK
ncbi:MAG: VWA-like domain-containing protein [Candidimonas sp.]